VDGAPITVVGLWDEWKDIVTGEPLKSCTMIITTASDFTSDTHDRIPVILEAGAFAPWLSGGAGTELLQPAANDVLQKWPVSKRVNSSRAPKDDPTLIERIEVEAGHLREPVLALSLRVAPLRAAPEVRTEQGSSSVRC
jgi:putative SOS response-associated peptidase YedK